MNMNRYFKFLYNYFNVQGQTPFIIQMSTFPQTKILGKGLTAHLRWN